MSEAMVNVLSTRKIVEKFGLCPEHLDLLVDVTLNVERKGGFYRTCVEQC
jgi:hypothetical protein